MWGHPEFRRINRVLTLVWGLTFLATAVLGCVAVLAPGTSDWTNWILPIALIVGAFKFTARHPDRASAGRGQARARNSSVHLSRPAILDSPEEDQ